MFIALKSLLGGRYKHHWPSSPSYCYCYSLNKGGNSRPLRQSDSFVLFCSTNQKTPSVSNWPSCWADFWIPSLTCKHRNYNHRSKHRKLQWEINAENTEIIMQDQLWKHRNYNARSTLKRRGLTSFSGGCWRHCNALEELWILCSVTLNFIDLCFQMSMPQRQKDRKMKIWRQKYKDRKMKRQKS